MTRRPSAAFVVAAALVGAAILGALAWSPEVVTPGSGPRPAPPRSAGSASSPTEAPVRSANRLRNVFVYDQPEPTPAPPLFVPPVSVPPALALPPPNPVTLVGFVRQGDNLRAALSVRGSVSVVAKGESADGYVVLAVDEDRGVTLRAPDGTEATLPPPPSR